MKIIDGRKIASAIETHIAEAVAKIHGRKPALSFILVGENPSSVAFIKIKKKKCAEVGILSLDRLLPNDTTEERLIEEIQLLNANPKVDGILVQLPLPKQIQTQKIIEIIDPAKDVDGFHPINMGKMLLGQLDGFFSCTPYGVVLLLAHANIDTRGKHVVILGRSNIVGKPLAALLVQKRDHSDATVTIAHSHTKNIKEICTSADILVAAMGNPHFVTEDMVKNGAVVIDVGVNRIVKNGKTLFVGDVDFENVAKKCSHISPVPGGVGPMTIAVLLSNTLLSYQKKQ
ncbi:MAG: bifunctional methylenetetrahydrofolate dehydrogenase/methenyltetrahydrofolate cyclohydrolase FolD [Chlamydiae bacterium]|nr:bifunctional methylenetetrahydrofolate dehydrogenase/methenyltetrahydrofolate cyclohydrolase FolD [Chlamydiota bacterium]